MVTTVKKETPTVKSEGKEPVAQSGQHPVLGLRQEVDSLFDNFFTNFSFDPLRKLGTGLISSHDLMPSMDVKETEGEFQVSAELPGMDQSNIELSITDGQLVIKGEKKEEKISDDENRHLMERHYGSVYRSLALPKGADEGSVDATYDKGVLTVTLKKAKIKDKATKTIKIKAK